MTEFDLQEFESPQWDVRGWQRLTIHEDPHLVAAREEFLSWLAEVPEPHYSDLNARLRSASDDAHLSARLELFIHHYFRSNTWQVEIHPQVPYSTNRPDFLSQKGSTKLIIECKSVFDHPTAVRQDQRLHQLADEASKKLSRTVILHPLSDLPSSIPARRIRSWIERQQVSEDSADFIELDFWDNHQGVHYGIRAILPRLDNQEEPIAGVQGLMSQASTVTNSQQLRAALLEKAGKYGRLEVPYVIAVSMEGRFPTRLEHELEALFGDRVWNIPLRGPVSVTETRANNGFFALQHNGVAQYSDVSAVLVYRFKWLEKGHHHRVHVYHNPYANKPIEPSAFPRVSQLVKAGSGLEWINGEPEPY